MGMDGWGISLPLTFEQLRTISSMSQSIPGHHMKLRAIEFILKIIGCIVCNS